MVAGPDNQGLPDWRDAAAYRFDRLDRPGLAWEWLRRDPAYREAAFDAGTGVAHPAAIDAGAAQWGLVRFEPPGLAAPLARAMWCADADREVLAADVAESASVEAGALSPARFGELMTQAAGWETMHLLLTDGWRRVRIDLHGDFDASRPVMPSWRLAGLTLQPQLLALRRLMSVAGSGKFANRLWPRDPRARRWILALRAHDALAAGAGHRALAELLDANVGKRRWRVRQPSVRLQAQRLAALALSLRGRAFADRYLRHR